MFRKINFTIIIVVLLLLFKFHHYSSAQSIPIRIQGINNFLYGSQVAISPDGKKLIFKRENTNLYEVMLLNDSSCTVPKQIDFLHTRETNGKIVNHPAFMFFSYDGNYIYYISLLKSAEPTSALMRYRLQTKQKEKILNLGSTYKFPYDVFSLYPSSDTIYWSSVSMKRPMAFSKLSDKPFKFNPLLNNTEFDYGVSRITPDNQALILIQKKKGVNYADAFKQDPPCLAVSFRQLDGTWGIPQILPNLTGIYDFALTNNPKIYFSKVTKWGEEPMIYYAPLVLPPKPQETGLFLTEKGILLDKATGKAFQLGTVSFEVGSAKLHSGIDTDLKPLLIFLQKNLNFRLEISAHTDNTGTPAANQKLSEQRAQSVANYLISKGIDKARLVSKGYGSTQPIADNTTEENKARNRRVEFKVLK